MMPFIYFDPAAIERDMRQMQDESFAAVLSGARSDRERDGFLAQARLFEPGLAAQLEMFRMLNEGRDPQFVGTVLGAFLGRIMLNTISASPDPAGCFSAIERSISRALNSATGAADAEIKVSHRTVRGTRGGRA